MLALCKQAVAELGVDAHFVPEQSTSSGATGVAIDDQVDGVADHGRHRRAPRIRELEQTCVLLRLETDLRSHLHRFNRITCAAVATVSDRVGFVRSCSQEGRPGPARAPALNYRSKATFEVEFDPLFGHSCDCDRCVRFWVDRCCWDLLEVFAFAGVCDFELFPLAAANATPPPPINAVANASASRRLVLNIRLLSTLGESNHDRLRKS
jgi:hypothetical protein